MQPLAIDLFCGAGGMSVGLSRAGFRIATAVDKWPLAIQTYQMNFPDVASALADITTVEPERLLKLAGAGRRQISLLAGCPPCQGFSSLRTRGRSGRADNSLVLEMLRITAGILPRAVMIENVPRLVYDPVFAEFNRGLERLGYTTRWAVRNSSDFGIAQRRQRLILIANRNGAVSMEPGEPRVQTVREAIGHLSHTAGDSGDPLHDHGERRHARVQAIIERIPKDGGSRQDLGFEALLRCHQEANRSRSGWGRQPYGRLYWDRPADTITGGCVSPSKGRFIHPEANRSITLREALLLQGFPANYRISLAQGKNKAALLIGNAIPPGLAEAHARRVARKLRE